VQAPAAGLLYSVVVPVQWALIGWPAGSSREPPARFSARGA
jgi:hypothetical protein